MLEAFNKAEVSEMTRRNLLQSWRNYILRVTEGKFWGWGEGKALQSWWLSWLLDSIAAPEKDGGEFRHLIEQWLSALRSDKKPSKQEFSALRLLTHDLAEIGRESWHS